MVILLIFKETDIIPVSIDRNYKFYFCVPYLRGGGNYNSSQKKEQIELFTYLGSSR